VHVYSSIHKATPESLSSLLAPLDNASGHAQNFFPPQAEGQLLIESSSDEEEDNGGEDNDTTNKEGGGVSPRSSGGLIDVEDMGKVVKKMKAAAKKRREEEEGRMSGGEPREMVTPMLHKALTKQGRSDRAMQP
jgi:hypothetical protein